MPNNELNLNKPINRLNGSMPKIGIRPTIDGRRKGVRESLEQQTLNLAKSVAFFLESNLRHSNGLPVECVISETIGGVAEAARAAELFARQGVGLSITVIPCWCYGTEDHRYGSIYSKSNLGIQRNRTAGCCLSCRSFGRS